MELRKSFLGMIKAFPGGWDAMAGALCMTRQSMENRIYERKGQGVLVETAMQMQAFSGTTLFAQAVAAQSGGTFVRLPDIGDIDNQALLAKFNELHAELGHLSMAFNEATADEEIDASEKKELTNIAHTIHRKAEELLALSFRVYCRDGAAAKGIKK